MIWSCSSKEPFKARDFSIAMTRHRRYVCGNNFFSHNLWWTPTTNVPRRPSAIQSLKRFYFETPPLTFPKTIVVCVPSGSAPPVTQLQMEHVQRISPDEIETAFIDRLAEVIEAQASEDELKQWRNLCLNCTYEYRVIDSEDEKHWSALQLRQNLGQDEQTMKFTTLQLVYDVINDRNRREKVNGPMTVEQVADGYMKNVKFAEGSEKVSRAFVDTACSLGTRVLTLTPVREMLLRADQENQNPFDNWTKLQTIMAKARTESGILWAFLGLYDAFKMGFLSDMSVRALQGSAPGMNGKGLVDLMIFKQGLLNHLLSDTLEKAVPGTENLSVRATIKAALRDHAAVRSCMTAYPLEPEVDLSWRGGQCKTVESLLEFVEGIVYGTMHESELKSAVKNRRTIEEKLKHLLNYSISLL